jgi:hypothetical protein
MSATEKASSKEVTEKSFSPTQRKALLADPLSTFTYLFECPAQQGSRNMVRAIYHARDLGASVKDTKQLLIDANTYWYAPMEEVRFEKLLDQVDRIFQS